MNIRASLSGNRTLNIIVILSFIAPTLLYFGVVLPFGRSLGPVWVTIGSIVVFSILYLLAFWGIKKEKISLGLNVQKIGSAALLAFIGWLVFAGLQLVFSLDTLANFEATLIKLAAWPRVLGWICIWLFTGFSEEFLFRGYLLTKIKTDLSRLGQRHPALIAAVISNTVFALWHIPNRIYQYTTGQLSFGMAAFSLGVVFMLATGFAFLYLRTNNIVLVGIVHALVDLPIVGDQNYAAFIILVMIGLVEISILIGKRRGSTKPGQILGQGKIAS